MDTEKKCNRIIVILGIRDLQSKYNLGKSAKLEKDYTVE